MFEYTFAGNPRPSFVRVAAHQPPCPAGFVACEFCHDPGDDREPWRPTFMPADVVAAGTGADGGRHD